MNARTIKATHVTNAVTYHPQTLTEMIGAHRGLLAAVHDDRDDESNRGQIGEDGDRAVLCDRRRDFGWSVHSMVGIGCELSVCGYQSGQPAAAVLRRQ